MDTIPTVLLLAGGESTRFWPLKEKTIMPFFGKPLLLWHYEQLLRIGIHRVTVVSNEINSASVRQIEPPKGLVITHVTQKDPGQAHAVLAAKDTISETPVFILNASDYYEDVFLRSFLTHPQKKELCLGSVRIMSYFPGGYLKLSDDHHVTEIIEKPPRGKEPSNIVRIMADYFPSSSLLIAAMEKYKHDAAAGYEQAINMMIAEGGICRTQETQNVDWGYLKYPWDVLSMTDRFLKSIQGQHIHPSVVQKDHVIIEGAVIIEEGVKIFEGTKIVGPCFIGRGTIIGNNNIIRGSHIGASCVTGFNTDITRSYIGENCWFHSNYIGDSVLSENVSLGSGAVLANLRLDDGEIQSTVKEEKIPTGRNKFGSIIGANTRIGVNTSIMPGVKIGAGTFISSGAVVDNDVKDYMFLKQTKETIVTENKHHASDNRDLFRKAI